MVAAQARCSESALGGWHTNIALRLAVGEDGGGADRSCPDDGDTHVPGGGGGEDGQVRITVAVSRLVATWELRVIGGIGPARACVTMSNWFRGPETTCV